MSAPLVSIELRPYQERGVSDIRMQYRKAKRRVLYVLPTGGGKTYTFSYIADSAQKKGGHVMILAHRKELISQASLSLAKLGVFHSIISPPNKVSANKVNHVRKLGKCFVDRNAHVSVASVQTLVNRLGTVPEPTIIIIDEAHHATAGQWRQILDYYPNACVLGVTATPIRSDGQGLGAEHGGVFDEMVLGPTMQELIELGCLVPPKIYWPDSGAIDLTGIRKTPSGDYNSKQLAERIATSRPTIIGDAVTWYRKLAHGKRAVAFCVSVAAARAQAEAFNEAGYRFRCLDGSMEDDERDEVISMLDAGLLDGITSCDLVSEGFDCPGLEVAILLRPTNSEALYLQQVGRVLRPALGKSFGIIIDHVGNTTNPNLGGLPHWPREWTLEGVIRKRGKANDSAAMLIRTCPKCYAVHNPTPVCPECGHVYTIKEREIDQVDGTLVEMTPEKERELMERKARRKEQGRAQTLEELQAIEKARGFKPGWADHVYKARQAKDLARAMV